MKEIISKLGKIKKNCIKNSKIERFVGNPLEIAQIVIKSNIFKII